VGHPFDTVKVGGHARGAGRTGSAGCEQALVDTPLATSLAGNMHRRPPRTLLPHCCR
jgi:hypothetical protein